MDNRKPYLMLLVAGIMAFSVLATILGALGISFYMEGRVSWKSWSEAFMSPAMRIVRYYALLLTIIAVLICLYVLAVP